MENESKECNRCKYYEPYYTRNTKHFNKTKCGRCSKKRCMVSSHDSCDEHSYKSCTSKSKRVLKLYLNDLLTDLTEIRQIIEVENAETKTK